MMRRLHLWVGLILGGFILVIAVSGTLLLARAPLLVGEHPQLRSDDRPAPPLPVVLEKITAIVGEENWTFISFPRDNSPAYEVGVKGDTRILFTLHGEGPLAAGFVGQASFAHWLHDLHVHLLAGEMGENIAGVAGLGMLFLGVSGLIVWWPYRRQTKVKDLMLRGASRPKLMRWHWTVGFAFSVMIVGLAVTGIIMSFHGAIQKPLMRLAGEDYGAGVIRALPPAGEVSSPDWRAIIPAAENAFPDDALGLVTAPRKPGDYLTFRTHRQGEWNPIGRSLIAVDPVTSDVASAWSALEARAAGQAMMAVYPLHAGKAGGDAHVALILLTGLAVIALAASGVIAYVRRPVKAAKCELKPDPATV